jgi:pSer/pThr/pTyr-binding forkhead associated (FHA) protein
MGSWPAQASAEVGADVGPEPLVSPNAAPDESTAAVPVVPRLIGQTGYLKDKVFYLDVPEFTVGRVKGSSLVVEDASVSRNHAKILHKGDSLVLFDLRSFNGTFVDDQKVTRCELRGGETVRFGDIAFALLTQDEQEPPTKAPKKATSRRRRMLVLATAGVVLTALVVAANILRDRRPPAPPPDPAAEQRALRAEVLRHLERATAELRRRDWDAATTTLNGVLKLDPLNAEAVRGLERAQQERERKGWMEESARVVETGRDLERAKALLLKIPEESSYYPDARIRYRHVGRTIAEEARALGLSYCRAWRYEECQRELCTFFRSWPPGEPIPDEVRVKRALERAEESLQRRQRTEFVACQLPGPGTGDERADAAFAERYPDQAVRAAVVNYFQGRADDGLRTLADLEKRRQYAAQRETIGTLIEHMIQVQNASAEAHRSAREGRLDQADRSFEDLKRADGRLVPAGLESRYVREASKLLGDAYLGVGQEHMRGGRVREAFEAWTKGRQAAPHHPQILQSLMGLESQAAEACQSARERLGSGDQTGAAAQFEFCRDITAPESPLHQGAVEALRHVQGGG